MKIGEWVIHVLFGLLLIFHGLWILTGGVTYRGYALPPFGGLIEILFGIVWLLYGRSRPKKPPGKDDQE